MIKTERREGFPLFDKEGLVEIFGGMCSHCYRLLSKSNPLLLRLCFLAIALSLFFLSTPGHAQISDILLRFQPYISVEETYDSNVFLTPDNEKDDWITTIILGLRFSTRQRSERTMEFRAPSTVEVWRPTAPQEQRPTVTEGERYGIDLDFAAIPTFYAKDTSDDYIGLAGSLDTWYTWDRRLTFRVRDSLIRSEEPLEESYAPTALPGQIVLGSQNDRAIYYRNIFSPSMTYQFGRENSISLNYLNNIYRNDNPTFEDSDEYYINPALNYWFNIRHGIFLEYGLDLGQFEDSPDMTGHLARGRYTYRFNPRTAVFGEYTFQKRKFSGAESLAVDYDIHAPALGFEYAFSPTLSVRAKGGYFWQLPLSGGNETGPLYDVVFTQRAQRTTYTLGFQGGYYEDYFTAENLGFAKYNQVIGTITHQLTQRTSVTFSGRYQRPEYNDGRIDNLYGTDGGISYRLFRWLTLGFNLSYAQNASPGEEEDYKDYRGMFRITAAY